MYYVVDYSFWLKLSNKAVWQMCSVCGVIKCVLYVVWSNGYWTDSELTLMLIVDTSGARCR